MQKGLIIILLLICYTCTSEKEFKSVKYDPVGGGPTFYLEVPKGYRFEWIASTHDDEYRYIYNDSSMIYVTNVSGGGPNYENIRSQGTYYKLFEAQNMNDTLLLRGVDNIGLYWLNKSFGFYSVGYKNVPKEKKIIYDISIDSFRKKEADMKE